MRWKHSVVVTAVLAVISYLLGSIPSGLAITYLRTGRDIRRHGSGNIGASNVISTAGWRAGAAVGVLDVLKGVIPVLIGRLIGLDATGLAVVALAAVLGHNFTIFLRFRGGKGVATSFGVIVVLAPLAGVLALVTWVVAVTVSRYASVASLVALGLGPTYLFLSGEPRQYVLLGVILFLLGAAKHWENIIRLARGTERPIGRKDTEEAA